MSNNNQPPNNTNKRKPPSKSFFSIRSRVQSNNRNNGPKRPTVSLIIPQNNSESSEPRESHASTPASASTSSGYSSNASNPQTKVRSIEIKNKCGPYAGWQLYFPETAYKDDLPLIRKIKAFEQHINSRPRFYKLNEIRTTYSFSLSLQRLSSDDEFRRLYPDYMEDFKISPMETLSCAGLAAYHLIQTTLPIAASQHPNEKCKLSTIRARIQGVSPIIHLGLLKENIYNCLISVRGTVVRVNPPEMKATWIAYRCRKCKTEQAIRQNDASQANAPTSCKGSGCQVRSQFIMLQNSPYTRCEPYQTIRLQESVQAVKGQIPKTIEVDVSHDLVETVYPGDDITVTGVMKVRKNEKNHFQRGGNSGGDAGIHKFYIYGVSIVSNKNTIATRNMDFSESEINMMKNIRNHPNLFKLLVHSLCPRIFGHEMVKAGLILSLFGGSGNGADSDKRPGMGRRSEIHVLVVGDPGLGKSVLIQSCSNVSPRGIFVCGNSASNAGLTVSIRRDKGSDGSLEAGALVLADQGVCCIDEFDKMSSNYQSLLQVMEQQTVSVAKAGVLCSLPARTSIIAAANPSGGHYDKAKTVSENLKIWPTLLSRFDLVFILLDRSDVHLDNLLTAHIQALNANHYKQKQQPQMDRQRSNLTQVPSYSMPNLSPEVKDAPLYERLKLTDQINFKSLSPEVLRNYIMYARKTCFPTISQAASEELYKFYSEMRQTRKGLDSVPVTTRQLEALVRMTQARARFELCSEATVDHALDVLAILRYTMVDVLSTDRGTLQLNRSINGSGISHSTKVKRYLQVLQGQMKNVFTNDELREIAKAMNFETSFNQIIDSLNVQGFLIKRSTGVYKFCI